MRSESCNCFKIRLSRDSALDPAYSTPQTPYSWIWGGREKGEEGRGGEGKEEGRGDEGRRAERSGPQAKILATALFGVHRYHKRLTSIELNNSRIPCAKQNECCNNKLRKSMVILSCLKYNLSEILHFNFILSYILNYSN